MVVWTFSQIAALTTDQIAALTLIQIAALTASQISNLSTSQIAALTTTQIAAMTKNQIAAFTSGQVANMGLAQLNSISSDKFSSLALSSLSSSQAAGIELEKISKLTSSQVSDIPDAAIAVLSGLQVAAIDPDAVAGFSSTQIQSLSTAQVGALRPDQVDSIDYSTFNAFSSTQIAALDAEVIGNLSPEQIVSFDSGDLAALSAAQVGAMDAEQLALISADAFTSAQKTELTSAEIAAIGTNTTLAAGISAIAEAGDGLTKAGAIAAVAAASSFEDIQDLAGATASLVKKQIVLSAAYALLAQANGEHAVNPDSFLARLSNVPASQVTAAGLAVLSQASAQSKTIPLIPLNVVTDNDGNQISEKPTATLDPTTNAVVIGMACGNSTPHSFKLVFPNNAVVQFAIANYQLETVLALSGIMSTPTSTSLPASAGVTVYIKCTDGTTYTVNFPIIDEILLTWSSAPTLPCFPEGTPVLTPAGYRAVETLRHGDLVLTADGRTVGVKVFSRHIASTTKDTAPYKILGRDFSLSPLHAFQSSKGVWQIPKFCSSTRVEQYGIGKPMAYYHLECPNFFRDNLVVNGCVVESFAGKQVPAGLTVYTPSRRLDGYTRISGLPSSASICKKS